MGRAVAMVLLVDGCLGDLYLHVSVFCSSERRLASWGSVALLPLAARRVVRSALWREELWGG